MPLLKFMVFFCFLFVLGVLFVLSLSSLLLCHVICLFPNVCTSSQQLSSLVFLQLYCFSCFGASFIYKFVQFFAFLVSTLAFFFFFWFLNMEILCLMLSFWSSVRTINHDYCISPKGKKKDVHHPLASCLVKPLPYTCKAFQKKK